MTVAENVNETLESIKLDREEFEELLAETLKLSEIWLETSYMPNWFSEVSPEHIKSVSKRNTTSFEVHVDSLDRTSIKAFRTAFGDYTCTYTPVTVLQYAASLKPELRAERKKELSISDVFAALSHDYMIPVKSDEEFISVVRGIKSLSRQSDALLGWANITRYIHLDGSTFRVVARVYPAKTEGIPVVYAIRNGGMYKVGVTTHLHRRLRELKPDEVVYVSQCENTREAEKSIHEVLKEYRVPQTEYFRVSRETLNAVLRQSLSSESCFLGKVTMS